MMMRSFTAANVAAAMELARNSMGEEAVILSTNSDKDGNVVVTFGLDRDEEPIFNEPAPRATPKSAASRAYSAASFVKTPMLELIQETLDYHAVPAAIAQDLLTQASHLTLPEMGDLMELQSALIDLFHASVRFDPLTLGGDRTRIILVGPPGSGKTMTAAKIAAKMVVNNRPLRVITTDTNRAGGIDQLAAFTKILGLELETATNREELISLLGSFDAEDHVLIDSAGCNPYDFKELKELGEFARIQNVEPILVCAAGTDGHEATEIASVFSFLDISRFIVTRTDCARHYGSLLALARAGDYAFSHATSSGRAMGDMQKLDAVSLAELFTHYRRERMAA